MKIIAPRLVTGLITILPGFELKFAGACYAPRKLQSKTKNRGPRFSSSRVGLAPSAADIRIDNLIHLPVHSLVHTLAPLVRIEPPQCAADAFAKRDGRLELRHERFDLAVIEDGAPHLVAQQSSRQPRRYMRNKVRRNMHNF